MSNDKAAATWHPGDGPTPRTAADVLACVARMLWDFDYAQTPPEWRDTAWAEMGGAEHDEERVDYELRAQALAAAGLLATAEPHAAVDRVIRPGQAVGFARWLAEYGREVRAQALRDAAVAMENAPAGIAGPVTWLHARADRIAAGEQP
jgi:hypothetical protein